MCWKRLKICAVVLLLGTGNGCASVQFGKPFDLAAFESLVKVGITTQAEVRASMGEPASTGVIVNEQGQRSTRWIYYFGTGTWPRLHDGRFKMLEIRFDRDNVVRAYNWSSG
jgi:hypothetical protein